MTFKETFRKFFSREILRPSGRASRSEFWWSYLTIVLVTLAFIALMALAFSFKSQLLRTIFFIPIVVFAIYAFFANLMTGIRRMHDINRSGWWYGIPLFVANSADNFTSDAPGFTTGDFVLIALVLAIWIVLIYLTTKRGDSDSNQYGPDPLAQV